MKKHTLALWMVFVISLTTASIAYGRDFFMFDLEKNKILHMGDNDVAFKEKLDIEKVPDLIVQTNDPNKFLAVYMPKEDLNDGRLHLPGPGQARENLEAYKKNGQILLLNIASGRTEDVVEIGVGPFQTSLSKDKKHFIISYRPDTNSKVYEILHYNIPEKKREVFKEKFDRVIGLDFSMDSSSLFALIKQSGRDNCEMVTMSLNPLTIETTIPAGFNPFRVYAISNNRVVLLDTGGKDANNIDIKGSVQLIDTEKNSIIATAVFKPSRIRYQWYKEQNTLFVTAQDAWSKWNEKLELVWYGHTTFIRVNPDGLKSVDQDKVIWDYQYVPKADTIYALPDRGMEIYDLRNGKESRIKTGINTYDEEFKDNGQGYIRTMNYFVNAMPEINLVTVYSNFKGIVNIYDLSTGKLLQTIKGAKMKKAVPEDYGDKSSVTTNQDKTRFYVLNRTRNGLTVFNEKMVQIATVDLGDQKPISMYQVEKPTFQTILATDKALYKVEDKGIKEICQYANGADGAYLYKDDQRLIFWTEKDWYMIDPATLEMKFHLCWFGDPKDKYTKVKQGEQRYFNVPTLDEWSE